MEGVVVELEGVELVVTAPDVVVAVPPAAEVDVDDGWVVPVVSGLVGSDSLEMVVVVGLGAGVARSPAAKGATGRSLTRSSATATICQATAVVSTAARTQPVIRRQFMSDTLSQRLTNTTSTRHQGFLKVRRQGVWAALT